MLELNVTRCHRPRARAPPGALSARARRRNARASLHLACRSLPPAPATRTPDASAEARYSVRLAERHRAPPTARPPRPLPNDAAGRVASPPPLFRSYTTTRPLAVPAATTSGRDGDHCTQKSAPSHGSSRAFVSRDTARTAKRSASAARREHGSIVADGHAVRCPRVRFALELHRGASFPPRSPSPELRRRGGRARRKASAHAPRPTSRNAPRPPLGHRSPSRPRPSPRR